MLTWSRTRLRSKYWRGHTHTHTHQSTQNTKQLHKMTVQKYKCRHLTKFLFGGSQLDFCFTIFGSVTVIRYILLCRLLKDIYYTSLYAPQPSPEVVTQVTPVQGWVCFMSRLDQFRPLTALIPALRLIVKCIVVRQSSRLSSRS